MRFLNQYDIPQILFSQLTWQRPRKFDISITELLKSPRQRQLALRHDAEIEIDASSNLWAFLGTACHLVLEKASKNVDGLSEERLIVDVNGWRVGGQPDLYFNDEGKYKLIDLKATSVYSYLLESKNGGVKPEWAAQTNLYKFLLEEHGFKTDSIEIWMILRDWVRSKARIEPDYPKIPFVVVKVPMWEGNQAKKLLHDRVALHQNAEKMSTDSLPLCTPEERWRKQSTWAVYNGGKKALRVFNHPDDAKGFADGGMRVVERPGVDVKCCPEFCSASPWCSYFQGLQNQEP